jgi:uncharacterized protein YjbI with pentapeptide repeats
MFVTLLGGTACVLIAILWIVPRIQTSSISNEQKRLATENEMRKTLAQIIGGAAFLIGVYFSWQQLSLSERAQITDRFTHAIQQLGEKQSSVRVGAIYALERIAEDDGARAWTVMDILAGFIRDTLSSDADNLPACTETKRATEIDAALNVIGRISQAHPDQLEMYRQHAGDLDLQNVSLCDVRLVAARLTKARLDNSRFDRATFERVILDEAHLTGAHFEEAQMEGASLVSANLLIAHVERAVLNGANLTGAVLKGAHLEGCFLKKATLVGADLTDAYLTGTHLEGADLSGIRPGQLTQKQIDTAIVYATTRLPSHIVRRDPHRAE